MKIVIPQQNIPVDSKTGVDLIWYEKLSAIANFINYFSEVNFSTMPNGQVLLWDATRKKFVPGPN